MRRVRRSLFWLVVTASACASVAASASADNLVPNPSFEDYCGVPTKACYWPDSAYGHRDTSIARTGSGSYLVRGSGGNVGSITSECIQVPPTLAGSRASGRFFYSTTDSTVYDISMVVYFFESQDCVGGGGFIVETFSGVPDGAWHEVVGPVGPVTIGWVAESIQLELSFFCANGQCSGEEVNYDDLEAALAGPTSAALASFSATRAGHGVWLRWRTAAETDLLGFNLYLQRGRELVKLNRALIPGVFGGSASGRSYSWLDRRAPRARGSYRLQAVSLRGKRSWLDTAFVSP